MEMAYGIYGKALEAVGQLCERTCRVRTCVVELLTVISSCVLEGKQIGRVLAGCDFRSVICELYLRTDRSCTCVRILEESWTVIKSCVLNCECNKLPSWIKNLRIHYNILLRCYQINALVSAPRAVSLRRSWNVPGQCGSTPSRLLMDLEVRVL
jgi:hypothetical protein